MWEEIHWRAWLRASTTRSAEKLIARISSAIQTTPRSLSLERDRNDPALMVWEFETPLGCDDPRDAVYTALLTASRLSYGLDINGVYEPMFEFHGGANDNMRIAGVAAFWFSVSMAEGDRERSHLP
jgi:hypothetical protein